MRAKIISGFSLIALVTSVGMGCDEGKKPSPPKAVASAVAPLPLAPSVPPSPPKEESKPAPRPKKNAADCPKAASVTFPNADFEGAVRLKIQKKDGNVTMADLVKLRSLNISQSKLNELDICLFPHMKELRELFIGPGEVEDLSGIASLTKLESLRLSLNPIRELEPLSGMTKLDRLDLAHTQVRDLTPLKSLTSLTELLLDDTPVEDVTPLASLEKLTVLVLKNTRVKDVKSLRPLKALKTLDLRGAPVDDSTMLARPGLRIQE
jgi:internalin A